MISKWLTSRRIRRLPRYGLLATMPSRAASLAATLPAMLPQVERLFVFLDGFDEVPDLLAREDKVTILCSQDHGALHCSGRLLPLTFDLPPFAAIVFDDDIHYPADYAARLVEGLARREGRALVGVLGEIFWGIEGRREPERICLHFAHGLDRDRKVHTLGIGTSAFLSEALPLDPRAFAEVNMDDVTLAIAAQRRGLPRIVLAREEGWLRAFAERQTDSIYTAALADPDSPREIARHALLRDLQATAG